MMDWLRKDFLWLTTTWSGERTFGCFSKAWWLGMSFFIVSQIINYYQEELGAIYFVSLFFQIMLIALYFWGMFLPPITKKDNQDNDNDHHD